MRGNRTLVHPIDFGNRTGEGFVKAGQTFYPGMGVIRDPSVALKFNRHTYKIYDESADGDRPNGGVYIVTGELSLLFGNDQTVAYAAGEVFSFVKPQLGDEFNLLIKNLAGTGDDHTKGEKLILDTGTGMFIATTGTPETEMAQLLETITDPTADTLAWCAWSGY